MTGAPWRASLTQKVVGGCRFGKDGRVNGSVAMSGIRASSVTLRSQPAGRVHRLARHRPWEAPPLQDGTSRWDSRVVRESRF